MKKKFNAFLILLTLVLNATAQQTRIVNLDDYTKYEVNDTIYLINNDEMKFGFATKSGNLLVPLEYDDADLSIYGETVYGNELFFVVIKNDKMGIVSNKKVYVEPSLDHIIAIEGAQVFYKKNEKFGIVTLKGQEILPAEYDDLIAYKTIRFSPEYDFIAVEKDGRWSVMNGSGKKKVDVDFPFDSNDGDAIIGGEKYHFVSNFYNGIARLSKSYLYGMVNPKGDFIVPVEYDGVDSLGNNFFIVEKYRKQGIFSKDGRQLAPCSYDLCMGLSEDSLSVNMIKGDEIYVIDLNGNERRLPSVNDLKRKYGYYVIDCNNGQAIVYVDGKPSVMAYDGTVIIPAEYVDIKQANNIGFLGLSLDTKSYYRVADETGYCAAFDDKGNQLTEFKYGDLMYVGGNKEAFGVAIKTGERVKCGICDSTGHEIIPLEYDHIGAAKGDFFALKRYGKYGIVNTDNKTIIPFELDSVKTYLSMMRDSRMIAVSKGNKWALVNENAELLTDFVFECDDSNLVSHSARLARDYAEGMAAAKCDSKYGFFDSKGNLAIPCIYEFVNDFSCGLAVVNVDWNQYVYIDKNGKTVFPFTYEFAGDFDPITKTAKVILDNQRLIINVNGEVVDNKWK